MLAAYESPALTSTDYQHASSRNDRVVDHTFAELLCLVAPSGDADPEQTDFHKPINAYPVDYFLLFEGRRVYSALPAVNSVFSATPLYLSTERFRL